MLDSEARIRKSQERVKSLFTVDNLIGFSEYSGMTIDEIIQELDELFEISPEEMRKQIFEELGPSFDELLAMFDEELNKTPAF